MPLIIRSISFAHISSLDFLKIPLKLLFILYTYGYEVPLHPISWIYWEIHIRTLCSATSMNNYLNDIRKNYYQLIENSWNVKFWRRSVADGSWIRCATYFNSRFYFNHNQIKIYKEWSITLLRIKNNSEYCKSISLTTSMCNLNFSTHFLGELMKELKTYLATDEVDSSTDIFELIIQIKSMVDTNTSVEVNWSEISIWLSSKPLLKCKVWVKDLIYYWYLL